MKKSTSTLAMDILEAVAAHEEGAPSEFDPLYEVIDIDALEDLFTSGDGRVLFDYQGCLVTVHSDGTVEVDPRDTGLGAVSSPNGPD